MNTEVAMDKNTQHTFTCKQCDTPTSNMGRLCGRCLAGLPVVIYKKVKYKKTMNKSNEDQSDHPTDEVANE